MDALSEQQLVGRLAAGEQSALGVLYERHIRPVYRFALAELRSREDAEDVAHETFLTLFSRAKSIRMPGESVLPWLLVTCRNLCRNKLRSQGREHNRRSTLEAVAEARSPEAPEDVAELNQLRLAVTAAIDALSADDRRLFALCIDGDLSYQAAADALGLSHGGVRNRVSRVRARLRRSIDTNQEVNLR